MLQCHTRSSWMMGLDNVGGVVRILFTTPFCQLTITSYKHNSLASIQAGNASTLSEGLKRGRRFTT